MKAVFAIAAALLIALTPVAYVYAHCQVPCGIYDDDARFGSMLEDQTTIAKAITSIRDLSREVADQQDPTTINQLTRWITTKEDHATNLQETISVYFMAQRIKPDDPEYVNKLTAAHQTMIAAMKCKQTADPAAAKDLQSAIEKFRQAYSK